jgi:hypothetical protein
MPDKKITDYDAILGANTASGDLFEIVDISANDNKKITRDELKAGMALNNVDNTADLSKPISTATQTALNLKEDTANKSTSVTTDQASNTKYPSVKSVYDWVVGLLTGKQDTLVSGTNIKTINSTSLLGSGDITISGGGGTWGSITGTLSSQTDLQTALDAKVDENASITGATKTKITYDAKGLVTGGADIAASDLPTGIDAAKISAGNVSNTEFDYLNGVTSAIQTQIDGKQASLGYTAENVANKSTSVTTDQASDTKYPSVKSVYDWATGLFATIVNLALKTDKLIIANRQTASYTLVIGDADELIEMNVATANNLTVPASVFSAGTQIILSQYGAGQTTIVAGAGMTIRSSGGKLKLTGQYSGATLIFLSGTEAYLFGDIAS